jgi:hypothetical protein
MLCALTLYSPVHTLRTSRFNIQKFYALLTQCMCHVWVAAPTTINFLYTINCWVFMMQTQCAYSAVRTEC